MAELTKLQKQLFELQDLKYRDFHSKLMPETDKETVIGIRTPVLRKFAKEFAGTSEAEAFCGSFLTDIMKKIIFT